MPDFIEPSAHVDDDTVLDDIVRFVKRAGGVPDEAVHDCIIGAKCYATAFKLSIVGCIIAFGLSLVAGFRRERMRRERRQTREIPSSGEW